MLDALDCILLGALLMVPGNWNLISEKSSGTDFSTNLERNLPKQKMYCYVGQSCWVDNIRPLKESAATEM